MLKQHCYSCVIVLFQHWYSAFFDTQPTFFSTETIMSQSNVSVTLPLSNYTFSPGGSSPLVSRERFAELVFGSTDAVGVVIGWCNKGLLPTVSVGKYSLVNLAALERVCVEKEFSL